MAKFYVHPQNMAQSAEQIAKFAQMLEVFAGEVDSVRRSLRFQIACRQTIEANLRTASTQIERRGTAMRAMHGSLEKILALYQQTEQALSEIKPGTQPVEGLMGAYDQTTKTFDDDPSGGTYAANQRDIANNESGFGFLWFRWNENEELFDFIRDYDQYQDYSKWDIAKLMDKINSEGCGYAAVVNNLFVEFEGHEEEFEEIFGFPMYNEDGEANYNYLLVDFYANTDDKYFLNDSLGEDSLVNDVILSYLGGREEEFREKYGHYPVTENGKIIDEAAQAILDEYQDETVVTLEGSGTTPKSLVNRFSYYLEQKGISDYMPPQWIQCEEALSTEEIKGYLESGQNVTVGVDPEFTLYNEAGEKMGTSHNHWMTITDVTEDGRYVVSSWGRKYYLIPSELNTLTDPKDGQPQTIKNGPNYFVTNVTVS